MYSPKAPTNNKSFSNDYVTVDLGQRLCLLSVLLILSCLASSCIAVKQQSLQREHYTLDYPPPKAAHNQTTPLPVLLRVEQMSLSPLYDTSKISYKESNRLSTYTYHRWRAKPSDLVSYYLTRDLQASGLFRAVIPADSATSPSHTLEGSIDEFLEQDEQNSWYASLVITLTLMDHSQVDISKKVIFQKSFSHKAACAAKTPQAVAQAMAKAMAVVSAQVTTAIHTALK